MAVTKGSFSTHYSFTSSYHAAPAAPRKPLEQMTDEEIAKATVEALKFPFICKSCSQRVAKVNAGGLCDGCTSWNWASIGTGHVNYSNATVAWTSSGSGRFLSWGTQTP